MQAEDYDKYCLREFEDVTTDDDAQSDPDLTAQQKDSKIIAK